jgi:hypothetical protein
VGPSFDLSRNSTLSARRWAPLLVALALAGFFLVAVARFWHPVYGFTALIQLDATNDDLKIAAFREHPVYVYRDTGGYDGLYYAQIAHHPLLDAAELRPAMDNFSYRARRILPPAVAWLLGAGQPGAIIHVYALLNAGVWLLAAVLLWRILAVADFRGVLAWAGVLFSAGALSSVRYALTDLPALTLLAAAMWALERSRPRSASGWLAAAALARETAFVGVVGLLDRPWLSRKNLLTLILAATPLAGWLIYVRWRVGPADAGWGNFTLPVAGLVEKWTDVLRTVAHPTHPLLAWTTLLAVIGLTVQAGFVLIRWRPADAWWRIAAAYTALMLMLGTAVWEGFPGAATRVLLPLTLAFNVVAVRTRAALAWLILGNLGVTAGLLTFVDVPNDSREIFAARSHGVATLVHVDAGWFGAEHTLRHVWSWCEGRGELNFETWPLTPLTGQFEFSLRSLTPRTVVVRQAGVELWRGPVGDKAVRVTFPLALGAGRTRLEFSSDTPGTRESPNADARALAFAIYDPRLTF